MQILIFTLGGVAFGIPLEDIAFIERMEHVVETPMTLEHVRGIIVVQKEVIPVYSLLSRFGYEQQEAPYLVVVWNGRSRLGLETGEVEGILEVEPSEVKPMPSLANAVQQCCGRAVYRQKRMILLLDVGRLIEKEEQEEICGLIERETGENVLS